MSPLGRVRRGVVALAVLSLEYLVLFITLAIFYDGPVLQQLPGFWQLLRFGTTFAAGLAVIISAFAVLRVARVDTADPSVELRPLPVLVHVLGYVCCAALTLFVFARPDALPVALANVGFCIWLACGIASLGAGYVCAFGWPTWQSFHARYALLTFAGVLAVIAWVTALISKHWWETLAPLTLNLARAFLELVFDDVSVGDASENHIGVGDFGVHVTDECSGLEGMGLIASFLAGYLLRFRKQLRFPAALWLLPIGLGLTLVLNALRIALLVGIGATVSPEIAKGGFHSNAGSLLFCALAVGLVYWSQRWTMLKRSQEPQAISTKPDATTGFLLPLVSMLAVGLITGAFTSSALDVAYALRWVVAGIVLYMHRQQYKQLTWKWSGRSVLIGAVVFVMWLVLPPERAAESSAAMQAEIDALGPWGGAAWLGLRFLGASAIVPLAEELAFRGYLQRRLISSSWAGVPLGRFTVLSFVVTTIAFGMLHPNWIAGILAGGSFALATYASGRLSDAVVAHATTNVLLCGWALLSGSWAYL